MHFNLELNHRCKYFSHECRYLDIRFNQNQLLSKIQLETMSKKVLFLVLVRDMYKQQNQGK